MFDALWDMIKASIFGTRGNVEDKGNVTGNVEGKGNVTGNFKGNGNIVGDNNNVNNITQQTNFVFDSDFNEKLTEALIKELYENANRNAKSMMSITDFTSEFVGRGIKIGTDMHSLDTFLGQMSRHCNNLVVLNLNENRDGLVDSNPFKFSGSMTCINYRSKYIGICTRRQLDSRGYEMRDVGWNEYNERELTIHPGAGNAVFNEQYNSGVSEHRKILFYDLTNVEIQNKSKFEERFFSLSEENILNDDDKNALYSIYGYLDQDQSGLDFKTLQNMQGPVSIRHRQIWCKYDVNPMNRHLGRCRRATFSNEDLNFKGIEGGPVFAIVMEDENLVAKFAGVLIESDAWSENKFDFVKASELKPFLDNF